MSQPANPTPPAVRLARVARPQFPDWVEADEECARCLHRLVPNLIFDADSLDDLALAERRVCEGRPQHILADILEEICDRENINVAFAPASARAAALIAFLDANPKVEEELIRHE